MIAPARPMSSPLKESPMVLIWPRTMTCEPRGSECLLSATILLIWVET